MTALVLLVFVGFWFTLAWFAAVVIGECLHRRDELPMQRPRSMPLPPTLTLIEGGKTEPAVYDWQSETA